MQGARCKVQVQCTVYVAVHEVSIYNVDTLMGKFYGSRHSKMGQ